MNAIVVLSFINKGSSYSDVIERSAKMLVSDLF
jgi:hypothetical protein